MQIIECEQGSMAWHLARRGIPTASNFDKILTAQTAKPSAQQDDFIAELIGDTCSIYFAENAEHFTNRAIQWGEQTEAEARKWYALEVNADVEEVGFCLDDDGRFGCSPDGLVGTDGGLELKCPMAKTHAGYVLKGGLPPEYKQQVHGALIVTGRAWWDFVSYAPGLPPLMVRVTRDEYTDKLEIEMRLFWEKYQAALHRFLVPQDAR